MRRTLKILLVITVLVDLSRLQSPFNSRYDLFAPCHVLLSPKLRIHTRIEPLDLELLNSEHYCSRRLNDGIIMLEPIAYSIQSWFSEHDSSRKHPFVRTRKMIKMTLQKEQIRVFKVTRIQVLEIFFSNRVFLEISSSEENFALNSLMRFTKIGSVMLRYGGGGRDVVVVIIEVVAIDVGSGEPDCDVMRSITGVVIEGTEEVS
uniref:Uncharacterized protein n=1 Tax=Tanacetum cinerariifolium TaxID=118510 RepID=A0A699HSX7_TANCI|nr:hypothetical protein [Tanacetum cinerariifolium]